MDDEAKQMLLEIRDSLRAAEESRRQGVVVSHDDVRRSRRSLEFQKYAFLASVFSAFILGCLMGYFMALGAR